MASPGNRRTFTKDVHQLYKSVETSTDGQATIIGISETAVRLSLMPKTGLNAHAAFDLIITCSYTYPSDCPAVVLGTPIFHPNIDPTSGSICLSILYDWKFCYSLLDVVKAMLYLFEHPNFDSINNSFVTLDDITELETKTKRLLAGLTVNGYRFTPNTAWCEWARENNCLPTEDDETETKKPDPQNGLCSKGLEHGSHDEFSERSQDDLSICTSETVPSFAKLRYSISADEESNRPYYEDLIFVKVASQRIAIIQPSSDQKAQKRTVYYFAEVWGADHHQNELGAPFFTLPTSNKPPGNEETMKFCQKSYLFPWNPMCPNPDYNNVHSYSQYSSSLNLSELFQIKTQAKESLTADFCHWAAEDGLGNKQILSGLFFEGQRRRLQIEHCDRSSDESNGSLGLQELFDISSSEILSYDRWCHSSNSGRETDSEITELEYEIEESVDGNDYPSMTNCNYDEDTSSELCNSSISYAEVPNFHPKMFECLECCVYGEEGAGFINKDFQPIPKWLFRQTRWSLRFAPRQTGILSMVNVRLPPWRVSNVRLLADVCRFCEKNNTVRSLVLLDPMSLSPLSPLLNLMHCDTKPASQLTGVLWMTPIEAISPFYRVPVPTHPSIEGGENVEYPRPFRLRLLTLGAFVTNWIAWLSRIETYNSTGLTRFSPLFITDSVAASYLKLLTLGCGQAPVADLWPLWLLRRLLTTSLNLSKLDFSPPFFHSLPSNNDFNFFFPFSDIDEI
ncbi:hypothetical protein Aperf_G00000002586 [Anoplocephala perfoliata]